MFSMFRSLIRSYSKITISNDSYSYMYVHVWEYFKQRLCSNFAWYLSTLNYYKKSCFWKKLVFEKSYIYIYACKNLISLSITILLYNWWLKDIIYNIFRFFPLKIILKFKDFQGLYRMCIFKLMPYISLHSTYVHAYIQIFDLSMCFIKSNIYNTYCQCPN